jgi:catechol 2,3-dioxygenase-like lactoylglutathione lyase family enzyme
MTTTTAQLLVNIDVDDLPRAECFYTAALGLRPGRRFGAAALELLGAAVPVYLLAKRPGKPPFANASPDQARRYDRHWTPVHLDFVVPDLEAAVAAFVAAGGREERPISEQTWGRMAVMADPFGHGICLLQWTGRGYDEIAV